MKKFDVFAKNNEDNQSGCNENGCTPIDTGVAAAPAPAKADAPAAPAAVSEKKKALKMLLGIYLPLIAFMAYMLSMPDSAENGYILGRVCCICCAVAAWAKEDGERLCKNVLLRLIATVFGLSALVEFIIFPIP